MSSKVSGMSRGGGLQLIYIVGSLLPRLVTPPGVKECCNPFTPVGVTNRGKRPPSIYIYGCSPPLLIPLTLEDIEGVRGWCVLFFPSYALEVFDEMPDTPF